VNIRGRATKSGLWMNTWEPLRAFASSFSTTHPPFASAHNDAAEMLRQPRIASSPLASDHVDTLGVGTGIVQRIKPEMSGGPRERASAASRSGHELGPLSGALRPSARQAGDAISTPGSDPTETLAVNCFCVARLLFDDLVGAQQN
jgi:hypothetical protein